jgi:hypothetical protein
MRWITADAISPRKEANGTSSKRPSHCQSSKVR